MWLTTRGFGITVIVLFGICILQASYWVFDQVGFARVIHDEMVQVLGDQAQWANEHLSEDQMEPWVAGHPHLILEGGVLRINPERMDLLQSSLDRRINRYRWEGGFFLCVLLVGIAVLVRNVRQHGNLLQRQNNFLASVGHELKSPLASIKLSAETLEMREMEPARVRKLSERMLNDVFRLEKFVGNILDSARLEAGTRRFQQVSLPLGVMVADVCREVGARYQAVGLHCDTKGSCEIYGDEIGTRAVIQNLVDNACKSVQAAGHGSVEVKLLEAHSKVELHVADGGLGFPPDESERIFERFYRVGSEMTRKTKGSGLGLHIARAAVEADSGRLVAHSDGPGKGATFTAKWPLHQPKERSA
ncbi:MAG: HAMP domain-containing sensor histidine kinase [Planctomycetota bacterium]|nr:HAMP domain-containing sensor histidine kinase [Planctomycetota bacterium]